MNIGKKIKQRRIELGWSQKELAVKLGYSNHATLSKIEAGTVDISQSKIAMFAEILRTTPAYLMNWEEEEKNNDIITDAVVEMRKNEKFLSIVETLLSLDSEKLEAADVVLKALSK